MHESNIPCFQNKLNVRKKLTDIIEINLKKRIAFQKYGYKSEDMWFSVSSFTFGKKMFLLKSPNVEED